LPLFPPQDRKAFHEAVLDEILEERVVSSRGRCNPRVVKRKVNSIGVRYQLRADLCSGIFCVDRGDLRNYITV